ncbi:hypothetical protein E3E38_04880 [Thermococcus sp. 18S1]|uniref:hypothetical protein n=1 Tax=Thermococcus sp. 18S1 TaxID=1638210 RepID=UPI00143897A4|nr:hypothetical protein [Thermococcus sp. 18S1]NJE30386.1 hypothetical protein [Thermococcus sp. 18S1]
MKRQGFIFTLDALLSFLLTLMIIASIVSITGSPSKVYSPTLQSRNKAIAQDILETMRTAGLNQLVDPAVIDSWIKDGTLDLTYVTPDMPPLDIAATYWAINDIVPSEPSYQEKAETILGYILQALSQGYKYQLIIDDYTSPFLTFDNSYQEAKDVGVATTMVSGYVKNTLPRGYVAKAQLTKGSFVRRELIGIQRVLAGGINPNPKSYEISPQQVTFYYQATHPFDWSFDTNRINSGQFKFIGRYNSSIININENLGATSVDYDFYPDGSIGRLRIYSGGYLIIEAYTNLSRSLTGNQLTEEYQIMSITYYYPNGNYIVMYPDEVYLTVVWTGHWEGHGKKTWFVKEYISSSKVSQEALTVSEAEYYISPYNTLQIGFNVALPPDASGIDGQWHAAQRSTYETMMVTINGNPSNPYNQNVSSFFHGGTNKVTAVFRSYGDDEIGFGSGSWLYLTYTTTSPSVQDPGLLKLYDVNSSCTGIYYLNSIFAPGEIRGIEATLTVEGIHEVRIYYSDGTTLKPVYINTTLDGNKTTLVIPSETLLNGILQYTTLDDLNKKNFNLIILLDAYYDPDEDRVIRYAGQDYNTSWSNHRRLYGYPNSFIRVQYDSDVKINRFYIPQEELRILEPTGDQPDWAQDADTYTGMQFSYYLPEKAIPWYVDVWSAIHFVPYPTGTTKLYEGQNAENNFLTFPLDLYLIRVAYRRLTANIMVPGQENTFKIISDSSYYTFRYNDSRALVRYFLYGYVPYGNIFPKYSQEGACGYRLSYWYNLSGQLGQDTVTIGNCKPGETPIEIKASSLNPEEYALDDAIFRLFIQLGAREDYTELPGTQNNPILIRLQGLSAKSIGIKNVPKSLGPIEVTLRIWRG